MLQPDVIPVQEIGQFPVYSAFSLSVACKFKDFKTSLRNPNVFSIKKRRGAASRTTSGLALISSHNGENRISLLRYAVVALLALFIM